MNKLTVILTLCGRPLHTLRWMWHANRVRLPFHVIVADGQVHPVVERVLSNPSNFPNLSYEYHRHADLSFTDFYKKCTETAAKVNTPYAMMSDNDDFLFVTGILKSIAYLDYDPEYVCAGGVIPEFAVVPPPGRSGKVVGKIKDLRFGYKQGVHDVACEIASERALDLLNRYQVIYYHVFRAPALRLMFEEVEKLAFTDLTIHEFFLAARAATLGKVKSDPSVISYIRQKGTSMLSTYYRHDWVHHLLHSDLPGDCRKVAAAIAGEVERLEGRNRDEFIELVLDAHAVRLRHMLGHTMMRHRFPWLFRLKLRLSWLGRLSLLPRGLREHMRNRAFWSALSRDCLDQAMMAQYRAELEGMVVSLQGEAFLSFAKLHAPQLE